MSIAQRIEAGELEILLGRHSPAEESPVWVQYRFESGIKIGWYLGGVAESEQVFRIWKPEHNGRWFVDYSQVRFSTVLNYLNQEVDVDAIRYRQHGSPNIYYFTFRGAPSIYHFSTTDELTHFFTVYSKHDVLVMLRRAGIKRVRLFTFGDPFLNDADRLAFNGEWV